MHSRGDRAAGRPAALPTDRCKASVASRENCDARQPPVETKTIHAQAPGECPRDYAARNAQSHTDPCCPSKRIAPFATKTVAWCRYAQPLCTARPRGKRLASATFLAWRNWLRTTTPPIRSYTKWPDSSARHRCASIKRLWIKSAIYTPAQRAHDYCRLASMRPRSQSSAVQGLSLVYIT